MATLIRDQINAATAQGSFCTIACVEMNGSVFFPCCFNERGKINVKFNANSSSVVTMADPVSMTKSNLGGEKIINASREPTLFDLC